MPTSSDTLVALESFIGRIGDDERVIREGELVRASDPAVKKWPTKFGPPRYLHEAERVEQATRAPGETR